MGNDICSDVSFKSLLFSAGGARKLTRSGQSIMTYTPMCKREEFIAPTRQTFIQATNIFLDPHYSRYVFAGPLEDTRICLGGQVLSLLLCRYSKEGSTVLLFSQIIGGANKYPCPPSPPAATGSSFVSK